MTPHDQMQAAIVEMVHQYGELSRDPDIKRAAFMLISYPIGNTSARQGRKLKLLGAQSGFPDLQLPIARGGYHGLEIELKWGKDVLKPTQKEWKEDLEWAGHLHFVDRSAQAAFDHIRGYIEGKYVLPKD